MRGFSSTRLLTAYMIAKEIERLACCYQRNTTPAEIIDHRDSFEAVGNVNGKEYRIVFPTKYIGADIDTFSDDILKPQLLELGLIKNV